MIKNPFEELENGVWLKGNLHSHTRSMPDGKRNFQEVVDLYAKLGYGFLMFSDHNKVTSPDAIKYIDSKGLILIPGSEITANGTHILSVNCTKNIESYTDRQRVIEEINANGGFAIIAHPDWGKNYDHVTIKQLQYWKGYVGLEIFSGAVSFLNEFGCAYSTRKWDQLLSTDDTDCSNAENGILGFACDDSHDLTGIGVGWCMVYTTELSVNGICDALKKGRFYASTGVTITKISVSNKNIQIETKDACRIIVFKQNFRRVAVVDGPIIDVQIPEDARFLRFECWGHGERFAWTQAFRIFH